MSNSDQIKQKTPPGHMCQFLGNYANDKTVISVWKIYHCSRANSVRLHGTRRHSPDLNPVHPCEED